MRWRGVLAVEGEVTQDGRLIEPMALEWSPPFPLVRAYDADTRFDATDIIVGSVEQVERVERDDKVLILGEGTLYHDPPERRDLAVTVIAGEKDYAGAGLDYPMALVRGDLRQVVVGGQRVWDECLLEVIEDGEG